MEIFIGVCVKNEEKLIIQMLESLAQSIIKTREYYDFQIVICANGCTDNTIPLVLSWIKKNSHLLCNLFILNEPNLIEAQRLVIQEAKKNTSEVVIFLDADIVVNEYCINELLKSYFSVEKERIKVAYAISVPINRKNASLIESATNLYNTSDILFNRRKHFQGRAFLIKTDIWDVPETGSQLIVDDIYLSLYIRSIEPNSIREISTAKVYFYQIRTYTDLYNTFRRTKMEILKCLSLFPEFIKIPNVSVYRKIIWKNLLKEPIYNIFLCLYLLLIRKIVTLQFKLETIFLKSNKIDQWKVTKTSKSI